MLFNAEAEQSVIGALLSDDRCIPKVRGVITSHDFANDRNKIIFRAIEKMDLSGDRIDLISIGEHLEREGELAFVGFDYLTNCVDSTPSAANVQSYAKIVKDKSSLRQLKAILEETEKSLDSPQGKKSEEIIAQLQTELDRVQSSGRKDSLNWMEVLTAADDAILEAAQRKEENAPIGIPTGIAPLDNRIGGLPKKRLIILAARPSLGKTAFALQTTLYAASKGFKVGMCSLEMGAEELGIRAYANQLNINGTALTFGVRSEVEKYNKGLAASGITGLKIWTDVDTYTLNGVVARAHEWKHNHNIDLFVVDHIGLIEHQSNSLYERVGEITRTLKKLAKKLDIPVLALCQLNRGVEKEKRRPRLSDLRDSGNIEQDCDVALFLHSDDEQPGEGSRIEIGALKTRYGKKGWLTESIEFDGKTQRFNETSNWYQGAA
jgi:replicative DNA helicase